MIVSYDTIVLKPPYQIDHQLIQLVSSISEKIGAIHAVYLHKPTAELRKKNRIKTIQSSLAIEGNTLSIEQVTAIFENKRVLGLEKEIIEVKNAVQTYEKLSVFDPFSLSSLLKAHSILMKDLIVRPGKLRTSGVGIVTGKQLAHLAPPASQVKPLLKDLLVYAKKDPELTLIKSCVVHYEIEFIHPFLDGNGRMGRLWQTLLLMKSYPMFEFLPIESLIKKNQKEYYLALSRSDKAGNSNAFITFMLEIIENALVELLQTQSVSLHIEDRLALAFDHFQNKKFTRKDYLRNFKDISTATASRDLAHAVKAGVLKKTGDKRLAEYVFKRNYPSLA